MSPIIASLFVFICVFGGVLLGMWLRSSLPKDHLDNDSRDTVKVGIGLIATITALVLGLVTAAAKTSFDSGSVAVKQAAINILALDRALARYGPETADIRRGIKELVAARIDQIWSQRLSVSTNLDQMSAKAGVPTGEEVSGAIRALKPRDDSQRAAQSRASDLLETVIQARWIAALEERSSIPIPFLSVLVFWLMVTFASFGLFAPRNATVLIVLFICAVSVSSALFLILELDGPFDGLIMVSAEPLRYAHSHINQ
jgi:Protein of unknown function (DUF4239)